MNHNSLKCFVRGSISLSPAGPNAPKIKIYFQGTIWMSYFCFWGYVSREGGSFLFGFLGYGAGLKLEGRSQTSAQLMFFFLASSTNSSSSFSLGALTTIFLCPPSVHSKNANSFNSSASTKAAICRQAWRAAVATHSAILQSGNLRSFLTTKIILQFSSSSSKSSSQGYSAIGFRIGSSRSIPTAFSLSFVVASTAVTLYGGKPISISSLKRDGLTLGSASIKLYTPTSQSMTVTANQQQFLYFYVPF